MAATSQGSLNVLASHSLSVAPHVRACRVDDQVILLDLFHGRYHGVAASRAAALSQLVLGWPAAPNPPAVPMARVDQRDSVAPLLKRGLVIQGPCQPTSLGRVPEPSAAVDGWIESGAQDIGARRLLQFVRGAAYSAVRLRTCTLQRVARSVEFRRLVHAGPDPEPVDRETLQSAVSAYRRTRPLVMSSKDRCLLDSLTLVEFLAAERLFPHWVIGVKTRPFGAHAWVQMGALVLNDRLERVRRFTPILVA